MKINVEFEKEEFNLFKKFFDMPKEQLAFLLHLSEKPRKIIEDTDLPEKIKGNLRRSGFKYVDEIVSCYLEQGESIFYKFRNMGPKSVEILKKYLDLK